MMFSNIPLLYTYMASIESFVSYGLGLTGQEEVVAKKLWQENFLVRWTDNE